MNWGSGIFWSLFAFVAISLLAMAIIFLTQEEELVDKNYYEKDLKYQSIIEARQNYERLAVKPLIKLHGHVLSVSPLQGKGRLELLYVADQRLDTSFTLAAASAFSYHLPKAGRWRLTLQWESEGKSYYHQRTLDVEKKP